MTSATTITGVAPSFVVDDVVRTAEWYRDALGFEVRNYYRDDHAHDEHGNDVPLPDGTLGDPFFAIISRDGHRVMLSKAFEPRLGVVSNWQSREHTNDAYFWCTGVDALCGAARAAGADILVEPKTQPYGIREFWVRDCDGRVLTFGEPVEG